MARRRHENGLKYQQRIEREQRRGRAPEAQPEAPVPPGATQMLENVAPPYVTQELHEPDEP